MLVMVWMGGIAPSGIWNGSSKSGDHGWVRGKCRTSRHGMQPANPPYMASQDQQMFVVSFVPEEILGLQREPQLRS